MVRTSKTGEKRIDPSHLPKTRRVDHEGNGLAAGAGEANDSAKSSVIEDNCGAVESCTSVDWDGGTISTFVSTNSFRASCSGSSALAIGGVAVLI